MEPGGQPEVICPIEPLGSKISLAENFQNQKISRPPFSTEGAMLDAAIFVSTMTPHFFGGLYYYLMGLCSSEKTFCARVLF